MIGELGFGVMDEDVAGWRVRISPFIPSCHPPYSTSSLSLSIFSFTSHLPSSFEVSVTVKQCKLLLILMHPSLPSFPATPLPVFHSLFLSSHSLSLPSTPLRFLPHLPFSSSSLSAVCFHFIFTFIPYLFLPLYFSSLLIPFHHPLPSLRFYFPFSFSCLPSPNQLLPLRPFSHISPAYSLFPRHIFPLSLYYSLLRCHLTFSYS